MTEQPVQPLTDTTSTTDVPPDAAAQSALDEQAIADLSVEDYTFDTTDETPSPMYDFTSTQEQIDSVVSEQPISELDQIPLPSWLDGFVSFLDTYDNPTPSQ